LWQSQRRKEPESNTQFEMAHRALYERVETSLSAGFSSVQRALVDLQLQLQHKLRQYREQQEIVLSSQPFSSDMAQDFEDNLRKIDRSLEAFTAHAENLSHIKLTLARAAAFVSPEGHLAQLVTSTQTKQFRQMYDLPLSETGSFASSVVGRPMRSSEYMRSLLGSGETTLGPSLLTSQPSFRVPERVLEKQDLLERVSQTGASPRIPNSTCFVFYLPPSATNETLRTLFTRYGTVLNAYVAMDKVTNRTRGFGFVDFSTPSEAQAAVAALDKYPLEGKFLSVSIKV